MLLCILPFALPQPAPAFDIYSLVVHDYFSDPLGWEESIGSKRIADFESFSVPSHAPPTPSCPTVVVVDSLSPLLSHLHLSVVCRQLLRLSAEHAVIALLHTDLHDSGATLALEHQCPTVVELGTSRGSHRGVAQVRHLRKTGKVLKSVRKCALCVVHEACKCSVYSTWCTLYVSEHSIRTSICIHSFIFAHFLFTHFYSLIFYSLIFYSLIFYSVIYIHSFSIHSFIFTHMHSLIYIHSFSIHLFLFTHLYCLIRVSTTLWARIFP